MSLKITDFSVSRYYKVGLCLSPNIINSTMRLGYCTFESWENLIMFSKAMENGDSFFRHGQPTKSTLGKHSQKNIYTPIDMSFFCINISLQTYMIDNYMLISFCHSQLGFFFLISFWVCFLSLICITLIYKHHRHVFVIVLLLVFWKKHVGYNFNCVEYTKNYNLLKKTEK